MTTQKLLRELNKRHLTIFTAKDLLLLGLSGTEVIWMLGELQAMDRIEPAGLGKFRMKNDDKTR